MKINDRKQLFVQMLSNVWENSEKASKFYQEIGQVAQDPAIKEVLEARAFISTKIRSTIEECFRLIGEKPVKASGRLQEIFVEDFRREVAEIQAPEAKLLFVLTKANHLAHLRMGELAVLTAAADLSGHPAVGVLLETCLADKMALAERSRRFIRNWIESKVETRLAA